jgi:hypothetical protein
MSEALRYVKGLALVVKRAFPDNERVYGDG